MTALNAILARQGLMNPQVGLIGGQEGLPRNTGAYNPQMQMNAQVPASQSAMLGSRQGQINPQVGFTGSKPDQSPIQRLPIGSGIPASQYTGQQAQTTGYAPPQGSITNGPAPAGMQEQQWAALPESEKAKYRQGGGAPVFDQGATPLVGPVQGSGPIYENQINRLMTNQGMSRENAIANQASAVRQGADFNNDGTVTPKEYQKFQGPQTGVLAAEQSLNEASRGLARAGDQAIIDLTGGTQQSRSDIMNASQAALQPLSGYARSGQDANTMQANLLGANGPAAQAAAMQQFQDSPGQAYLREEQERAVLRNAAATGGTQGGAVLEELQRRAYGLAGTAFNDRVAQLGGLGSQGLTAAQGQAGIMGDTGMALSGLAERGAGNLASTRLGIAGQQAGIQGTIAGGRTRAGELLAQNIGSTTANLANLQNAQGAALAEILSGGQFAEIMAKAGITDANTLQQLATLLANISTGQGSQATGLGSIPGVQEQKGGVNRFLSAIPS